MAKKPGEEGGSLAVGFMLIAALLAFLASLAALAGAT